MGDETQREQIDDDVEYWAARIRAKWQALEEIDTQSVQKSIELGLELIEAKAKLCSHGQWLPMIEKVGYGSASKAERLVSIAADPVLADPANWSKLPPSRRALYALSRLDKEDRERKALKAAIAEGRVSSEITERDVKALAIPTATKRMEAVAPTADEAERFIPDEEIKRINRPIRDFLERWMTYCDDEQVTEPEAQFAGLALKLKEWREELRPKLSASGVEWLKQQAVEIADFASQRARVEQELHANGYGGGERLATLQLHAKLPGLVRQYSHGRNELTDDDLLKSIQRIIRGRVASRLDWAVLSVALEAERGASDEPIAA